MDYGNGKYLKAVIMRAESFSDHDKRGYDFEVQ